MFRVTTIALILLTGYAAAGQAETGKVSTKIEDASVPFLSTSGRRLSFKRYVLDPNRMDLRGNLVPRPDVWVRDLKDGSEERVVANANSVGWLSDSILKLKDGRLIDVQTKLAPDTTAKLPERLQVKNLQWAPNGKAFVYLPAVESSLKRHPYRKLYVVQESLVVKPLDLGTSVNTDANGFLSYSPDGNRVAFHLLFFRDGEVPIRRIGTVGVTNGEVRFVGVGEYCHYNWGLQQSEQMCSAPNPWDPKGEHFLFVTGTGNGNSELYISNADSSEAIRLTEDGLCKWAPAFDPTGRRVAFCSAEWGGMNGSLHNACIRILNLTTGEEQKIVTGSKGQCNTLAWTPDGSRLIFDWIDGKTQQIMEVKLEPAPATLGNSPISAKFQRSKFISK